MSPPPVDGQSIKHFSRGSVSERAIVVAIPRYLFARPEIPQSCGGRACESTSATRLLADGMHIVRGSRLSARDALELSDFALARLASRRVRTCAAPKEVDAISLERFHAQAAPGAKRGFRDGPAWFRRTPSQIVYYAPPEEIPSLLTDLGSSVRICRGTLLQGAVIAEQIVAIHPFFDGNGRVAREVGKAIARTDCSDGECLDLGWFASREDAELQALRSSSFREAIDWTPFTRYWEAVRIASQHAAACLMATLAEKERGLDRRLATLMRNVWFVDRVRLRSALAIGAKAAEGAIADLGQRGLVVEHGSGVLSTWPRASISTLLMAVDRIRASLLG